jgi:hypothetical protein
LSDDPRPSPDAAEPVDLVDVCRHILRIVARLEITPYTESHERQTVEVALDDPADPASDVDTPQGWNAL